MEKILLLSDAFKINQSTVRFGSYLAGLTKSKLVGILLQDPFYQSKPLQHQAIFTSQKLNAPSVEVLNDIEQSTLLFMEEARKHHIRSEVFIGEGIPEEVSLYESRFADLLVVEPDLSFTGDNGGLPSGFVRNILFRSECPVILAPHSFNTISQIVYCYDGSPSALYAIKQFSYLFPQYKKVPLVLLIIRSSSVEKINEKYDRVLTWLNAHYEHIEIHFLKGIVKDELFPFLFNKKDTFIVMGAYGRNMLSYMAKKSASDIIIKTIDLPLFISHH